MGMKSAYAVRTSGLSQATQVAVLEALAVFKNEQTGLCFPSTEKISLVSRVSVKYVRKSLRELEEAGLISSQQKAGGVRYFTLYLDKLPPSPVFLSEGTNVTPDDKDLPRDNCHPRDICPDTPCELSPPPRDNCPVTPVTNVTPIREEIREVNQERTGSLSPLPSDDLVLSPDSDIRPWAEVDPDVRPCSAVDPEVRPWSESPAPKHTQKNFRSKTTVARPDDVGEQVWEEFLILRQQKKKTFTDLALQGMRREAKAAGLTLEEAMTMSIERGWQSFQAKYVRDNSSNGYRSKRQPTCPGDWENEYKGVDYTRGAVMKEFTPEESARLATLAEEMNF